MQNSASHLSDRSLLFSTVQQFKIVPVKIVTSLGKLFHNQKLGKEKQSTIVVPLRESETTLSWCCKQWQIKEAMKKPLPVGLLNSYLSVSMRSLSAACLRW